jgi:group I intron endonuclease
MAEKYENAKIYKLVNSVDDQIYVGSTCMELRQRKWQHKGAAKRFPDRVVYKHLFEVGLDNMDIELVESFPCNDKTELHTRERHWIDTLKPALNLLVPTRKLSEYVQTAECKQKRKVYNQSPKMKQQRKEYSQTEVGKQKHQEAKVRYAQTEEAKAKRKAYLQSPEGKAMRASVAKRYAEKKKLLQKQEIPIE